jgi:hypothetical protein
LIPFSSNYKTKKFRKSDSREIGAKEGSRNYQIFHFDLFKMSGIDTEIINDNDFWELDQALSQAESRTPKVATPPKPIYTPVVTPPIAKPLLRQSPSVQSSSPFKPQTRPPMVPNNIYVNINI